MQTVQPSQQSDQEAHFADEGSEARRGEVTCLGSQSCEVTKPNPSPGPSDSRPGSIPQFYAASLGLRLLVCEEGTEPAALPAWRAGRFQWP